MDELITSFLDFTGTLDPETAQQFLQITNNDLEYAVQLFLESNAAPASKSATVLDEDLAKKLQEEAYGTEEVREADSSVHRHETLVDDFPQYRESRPTDIFGAGRVGIFNQRFDEDENAYYEDRDEYGSGSDSDVVEIYSSDEEPPRSRRRINRDNRLSELTSTQRRLANLFRPPFDIMEKISIDTAKTKARQSKKWILVNIQDLQEFRCQVLNRDFWSDKRIKDAVKQSFVFLQYQKDSPNGEQYVNFYHVNEYPHIAILDPLTGERVHKFVEGNVPDVEEWLEQVEQFLARFSLFGDNNPIVEHEVKFDPDALTEEQQIEYAMKQSIRENKGEDSDVEIVDVEDASAQTVDPFDAIKPQDHDVESTSEPTTRVQVRFPNGKRVVHKFKLSDTVSDLYGWLKYALQTEDYGLAAQDRFTVTSTSNRAAKLIEMLDSSIEEAGLKGTSILLEKE